jgi:hypothetical protein
MVVMGLGQLYSGQRLLGLSLACLHAVTVAAHAWIFLHWHAVLSGASLLGWSGPAVLCSLLVLDLILLVFWTTNVIEAYREAEQAGGVHRRSRPVVAGLASLLVPGWGHLLTGRPRQAVLPLVAGSFQTAALALGCSAPAVVAAGQSTLQRRSLEELLLMLTTAALALLPMRIYGAREAASWGRRDTPWDPLALRCDRRRRARLLAYLLVAASLLATDRFPSGYYERAVLRASLSARNAGLTVIPDTAEALLR